MSKPWWHGSSVQAILLPTYVWAHSSPSKPSIIFPSPIIRSDNIIRSSTTCDRFRSRILGSWPMMTRGNIGSWPVVIRSWPTCPRRTKSSAGTRASRSWTPLSPPKARRRPRYWIQTNACWADRWFSGSCRSSSSVSNPHIFHVSFWAPTRSCSPCRARSRL